MAVQEFEEAACRDADSIHGIFIFRLFVFSLVLGCILCQLRGNREGHRRAFGVLAVLPLRLDEHAFVADCHNQTLVVIRPYGENVGHRPQPFDNYPQLVKSRKEDMQL